VVSEVRVIACPKGFRTAAVAAGIKKDGIPDLALICSQTSAVAAAVFTRNTFAAAPIVLCKRHLAASDHRARALIVNSGNANAATGPAGIEAAELCAAAVAAALGCGRSEVLVASTGVIGRPLPADKIRNAIPRLISSLQSENGDVLARAIMTTDTFPKIASAEFKGVRIVGVAKGAGMIHPDMATMLSFVMTDAEIEHPELQRALQKSAARSFNSITVDGDTSTNDMLAVLANGQSGVRVDAAEFEEELQAVCCDLARAIARDGEGASKFVELIIEGAPSEEAARTIGRAIAKSPLVKTAIHGADPNWGRIVAAIGNTGIPLESDQVEIYVGDIPFAGGNLEEARRRLSQRDVQIRVVLHSGSGRAEVWTCDLTRDYIAINADYTT
jgi:glutamate N-acetyltransferase/amino-acid N-acetyltransferase